MKNASTWVGIIILIFSVAIFGMSLSYEFYSKFGPGPGLLPRWISGLMILLSILFIIDSIKKGPITDGSIVPKGRELGSVLTIIGSLLLFILLASYAGYNIAGVIMMFLMLARNYKWYWSLGISAVSTIFFFIIFYKFLQIPLPLNAFGW